MIIHFFRRHFSLSFYSGDAWGRKKMGLFNAMDAKFGVTTILV